MRGIFTEYVRYLTGRQQKPKRFFGVDRNMTGAEELHSEHTDLVRWQCP